MGKKSSTTLAHDRLYSPSTEVLNGVLESDGLGDRDTVLGDLGSTERLACESSAANSFSDGSGVEKKVAGHRSELSSERSVLATDTYQ